jgi:hypothetical protein
MSNHLFFYTPNLDNIIGFDIIDVPAPRVGVYNKKKYEYTKRKDFDKSQEGPGTHIKDNLDGGERRVLHPYHAAESGRLRAPQSGPSVDDGAALEYLLQERYGDQEREEEAGDDQRDIRRN